MSLGVPFHRGVMRSATWPAGRPSATTGVTLTSSGTSHTIGTLVELFAETTHETHFVRISFANSSTGGTQTDQLVNIYVGANGAEQVLIPTLLSGWALTLATDGFKTYEFPLHIPAGTRITAGVQALIASDTVECLMEIFNMPGQWTGSGVECIGVNVAASQGTAVTPGTTSDGSFTDIGTTAHEWRYVVPMMQGTLADTIMATDGAACDIGVGGGVYTNLEEFWFKTSTNEVGFNFRSAMGRFCVIPAGTALQLRAQSYVSSVDPVDFCIYGVY